MLWWQKCLLSILLLSCSLGVAVTPVVAQTGDSVFPEFEDDSLPSILEGEDDGLPDVDDELPAPDQARKPLISEDELAAPEEAEEAASDDDTSPFADDPVQMPPAVRNDPLLGAGEAEADNDEGAEILPQETVTERYADGKVKIERGVSQDERENYVNHGPWRMWDEAGNQIVEGVFRFGKRHGKWVRWYQAEEAELFQLPPFNQFTAPFRSQATFRDGTLNGHWIVTDAKDRKVCDWAFANGRRHGASAWFYYNGNQMRVIQYRQGQIHGELLEWDANGQSVTRVEYQDGRRLEKTVESYADGQKKVEGTVLQARLVIKQPDDWWEAKLATYVRQGKDQKHGQWAAWYENGQMKFTGQYSFDKASGEFTWWHENGTKSLHAFYDNGQKTGSWTWWHGNGQKAIQGQYLANSPVDRWIWWNEEGKVAQRIDFTPSSANGRSVVSGQSQLPAGVDSFGESILLRQPQN